MTKIRSARNTDIRDILEIQKECRLGTWTEADYQKEIIKKESLILIAIADNKAIGYISARFVKAKTGEKPCRELSEGDIINFGVLEKHRNRGAGSELINEFIRYSDRKSADSIWLEVREQNLIAIRFYEKHGFTRVQVRKNFYANPIDNAIVMKLDMSKIR